MSAVPATSTLRRPKRSVSPAAQRAETVPERYARKIRLIRLAGRPNGPPDSRKPR